MAQGGKKFCSEEEAVHMRKMWIKSKTERHE